MRQAPKCKEENCEKLADTYNGGSRGWCGMHYHRLMRNGHPQKLIYEKKGFITATGYRFFSVNGGRIREHRKVMEEAIGRKLRSNEIVHHINGDKTDNRLSNLELMSRAEHARIHSKEILAARWSKRSID